MSTNKLFWYIIKYPDIYPFRINLKYGTYSNNTVIGGIVSLFVKIPICLMFYLLSHRLISRTDSEIVEYKTLANLDQSINYNETEAKVYYVIEKQTLGEGMYLNEDNSQYLDIAFY